MILPFEENAISVVDLQPNSVNGSMWTRPFSPNILVMDGSCTPCWTQSQGSTGFHKRSVGFVNQRYDRQELDRHSPSTGELNKKLNMTCMSQTLCIVVSSYQETVTP